MYLMSVFLMLTVFAAAACSGGNRMRGLDGDAGNPQTPSEKIEQIMNSPVSAAECGTIHTAVTNASQEMMAAIRAGDASCALLAIQAGNLDVNTPIVISVQDGPEYPIWNALSTSALFFARGDNDDRTIRVLKVLVEAGVNLEIKNNLDQTPLHYALEDDEVFSRYPLVASYFIISGKANLNATNADGFAPIHLAIRRKSLTHLKVLVDKGAGINAPTADGKTPLALALDLGFNEGVELLKSHNAQP